MSKAKEGVRDPDMAAVQRCLAGEREAFADLLERHKSVVYSVARHMLKNETEAEDMAQEAFVKAYMNLKGFRGDCSFRNWICRIATHLCIDRLRAQRPEKNRVILEEPWEPATAGPEEAITTREQVRMALGRIPAHLRAAVVLRHLEDLSYEEMAEALKLPMGTVKTHLRRGREALKRELEKLEGVRISKGRKEK
jgi:RNA polymerase sigma-70 factor (ECF subfamily)